MVGIVLSYLIKPKMDDVFATLPIGCGGMTGHILVHQRISDSIWQEIRKVREQVFEVREQRRGTHLELDQEQRESFHFSDYYNPLKILRCSGFLS